MHELTDGLGDALERRGAAIHRRTVVTALTRVGARWEVHTAGGALLADAVVLAVPGTAAARLIAPYAAEAAAALDSLPYAAVSVVALGVRREQVRASVDGFGFLAPSRERRAVLGCLLDSSVYEGRAPEGRVLIRAMVGGARAPEKALAPDDALLASVRAEVRDLLGVEGEPELTQIVRWPKAIPQYELGHADRVATVTHGVAPLRGLIVGGNLLNGVGVNDCARDALRVAKAVQGALEGGSAA